MKLIGSGILIVFTSLLSLMWLNFLDWIVVSEPLELWNFLLVAASCPAAILVGAAIIKKHGDIGALLWTYGLVAGLSSGFVELASAV
jgi:hypothetical protein